MSIFQPLIDAIDLALLANGNGNPEFQKILCVCDCESNACPCQYCAIDSALRRAKSHFVDEMKLNGPVVPGLEEIRALYQKGFTQAAQARQKAFTRQLNERTERAIGLMKEAASQGLNFVELFCGRPGALEPGVIEALQERFKAFNPVLIQGGPRDKQYLGLQW